MKLFLNIFCFVVAAASLLGVAQALDDSTINDSVVSLDRKLQVGPPTACQVTVSRPMREMRQFCTLPPDADRSVRHVYPLPFIIKYWYYYRLPPFNRKLEETNLVMEDMMYDGTCAPGSGPPPVCECVLSPEMQEMADAWENEPLPPPENTGKLCQGKIKGEPHVKTYNGTKYDFHTACDLVATSSPTFDDGTGLDIHVRTTFNQYGFAYVSAAVLRIGNDFLELQALPNSGLALFINGAPAGSLPTTFADYPLIMDGIWYRVMLNDYEMISFASPVGMMKVVVDALLPGTIGLLVNRDDSRLLGRDGMTELTPQEMGTEWQVGAGADDHPPMFMANRAPQHPASCGLPPVSNGRRLGEDSARRRVAEEACAGVTYPEEKDDCIFDVIQTGDAGVAVDYLE